MPGASGRAARRRVAGGGQAQRHASRDGASPSLGLGRWEASRQFTDGLGRRLAFARYIPPGVPRQGMPLVVLHGCRQTALSFAQGSRMNQWADAAGFMVLYPQQSMARQVQRCWRWFQPDALHGGGEADLIAALVRSEVGRHGLDPTRVYIAGLSAGAGMAAGGAAASAAGGGAGHAFRPGDGRCAAAGLQTMRRGALKPLRPLLKAWPIRPRCAWACRPSSCRASSIPPWRRATRASCSISSACSTACIPRTFR